MSSTASPCGATPPENRIVSGLASVGRAGAGLGRDFMLFVDMLGALGVATARVITRPREYRFTSTVNQFDRVAWQAVPIILLITFLIGGIIAQQGIFHFRQIRRRDVRRRSRRHLDLA